MPDKSIKTESGEPVRLTADVGRSSLKQYGGYISEEFDPDLRGIRGARVYDEMRRNEPTVAIGLRAIKWMIGRVLWSAEPGGTTPADEEAAKFLQSCMEDCAHTFGKFVRDALTMLEFGYSWNEVTYKVRGGETGDPPSRYDDGRIGWHKMTLVGQDSLLQWDIAFDGTIRAFVQQPYYYGDLSDVAGQGLSLGPVTIPMEKSILFRLDDEKNNPEGISLLRSAYLPWYKKKQIEEIEAIGIERDLTGVLVINMPVGATDTDRLKALELLEQFKADDMTGFVAPQFGPGEHERWRFDIINSPGSKTIDTDKVIQRYQLELARNFLAQFLMLGQGPTGSRALSEDHSALFQVALLTIVENLADTMNRFLVPPLFRFNDFGQLTSLPTIKAGRLSKEQMERFATALSALATAGLLTPDADLEGYIREQLDLPERSEEVGQDVPDEDTGAQADAAQKSAGKGKKAPPEPEEPETGKGKKAHEFSEEDDLGLPDPYDEDMTTEIERQLKELEGEADGKASNDPELPDLDDDEAWQRFEEESNKRIQKSGKRSAGELLSFARPYNYAGKLNEHQAGFRATMQGLAAQLRDGKIDHGQWSYQSKVEIMRHTADGYRIGVAQAKGITPAKVKLSAADRQGIATAVKRQYGYFNSFSKSVSDKIAAGEALTTGVDSRAGLYAGAVRSAASQAKVADDPEKMLRWQRHKNDSCSTCLSMEGKTKSARDWQEGGILPASGTECHGNCGCSLDPVA